MAQTFTCAYFYLMALEYRTLDYKPQLQIIDKKTGQKKAEYLDLLVKTWETWPGSDYFSPIIINKYYVGRPDLVSLAVYGSDEFGDMICKFNGISNPFELNEGMIIQIPPLQWATDGCAKREMYATELIKSAQESIQPNANKKIYANEAHSSSATVVGDKPPYIIDRTSGLVIY